MVRGIYKKKLMYMITDLGNDTLYEVEINEVDDIIDIEIEGLLSITVAK